jgi:5'(3')-deoxyribonucleotidase
MKRIAVDMDEVIADFVPKHLEIFNRTYSENVRVEDIQGKLLRDHRPERRDEINRLIHDPSFFRDLKPMKDSQRVLEDLTKRFEVFITTAAMEVPTSFTAKYEWLKEFFPFINELNYVFCGDKSIIHADYLIDDSVRHFERFSGRGILFTSHHNIAVTGYDRVSSWQEVEEYFGEQR